MNSQKFDLNEQVVVHFKQLLIKRFKIKKFCFILPNIHIL